jgi:hypothetical protein
MTVDCRRLVWAPLHRRTLATFDAGIRSLVPDGVAAAKAVCVVTA